MNDAAATDSAQNDIVTLTIDRDIAHLHFEYRIRSNGLDLESIPRLRAKIAVADADETLKFLVIHGYKDRFCIGGSGEFIRHIIAQDLPERVALIRQVQSVVRACLECRLLTIICLDGLASGAGVDLALAGDLVLATPAARISLLYSKLGLVPDTGFGLIERRWRGSPLLLYAQSDLLRTDDIVRAGLAEAATAEGITPASLGEMLRRRFRHDPVAYRATKTLAIQAFQKIHGENWEAAAQAQAQMLGRAAVQERIVRSSAMQSA